MHLIPQSASHWHLLVSIFPSIGLIFVLGFYVTALVTDDAATKRSCLLLFGILGLLTIPTYLSGDHSMAVLSRDPKISQDLMSAHFRDSAGAHILELLHAGRQDDIIDSGRHRVAGC